MHLSCHHELTCVTSDHIYTSNRGVNDSYEETCCPLVCERRKHKKKRKYCPTLAMWLHLLDCLSFHLLIVSLITHHPCFILHHLVINLITFFLSFSVSLSINSLLFPLHSKHFLVRVTYSVKFVVQSLQSVNMIDQDQSTLHLFNCYWLFFIIANSIHIHSDAIFSCSSSLLLFFLFFFFVSSFPLESSSIYIHQHSHSL